MLSTLTIGPIEPSFRSRLSVLPISHPNSMAPDTSVDRRKSGANETASGQPALLIRRLPRNTSPEAVRTMLLFAKDLVETEIIPNEFEDDIGFTTAVARFSSITGASEAQVMLDGKPNTAGQANMIVDLVSGLGYTSGSRRGTLDQSLARKVTHSVSPTLQNAQKSSRFNGTFQSMDKISPPQIGSPLEQSSSETSSHFQTIFSPQSMVTDSMKERSRVSGKSVIGEDGGDDETGELLKDPLAYLNNNASSHMARKSINSRVPTNAFSSLSLNTQVKSPPPINYASPRSAAHSHASHIPFSPNTNTNSAYPMSGQYLRHNYPPVNPADQNPPCNTLYVGNLPIDTSEDELKAMFSKQRGYKRLCFRTKQNGPMCFVEFEDVSFATKALNELYGVQLHNSVKGGIRLSFSKNPLGVRAGQPGSANPATPMSATGPMSMSNLGGLTPGGFATANGPPPGLSMPPGFGIPTSAMIGANTTPIASGQFLNQGLGIGNPNINGTRGMPIGSPSTGPATGAMYPDYMMGR